jgi:hypothetical protein
MMRNSEFLLADVGLPMIALTFPAMVVLLVPIVLLEAWVLRKWLSIGARTAIKASFLANAASTIVGVPGAWAVVLILEFFLPLSARSVDGTRSPLEVAFSVLVRSAWIAPTRDTAWMIPVAVLGLLVPTYFASVLIEGLIIDHMLTWSDQEGVTLTDRNIHWAVWKANLVSYGLLALMALGWLLVSLLHQRR